MAAILSRILFILAVFVSRQDSQMVYQYQYAGVPTLRQMVARFPWESFPGVTGQPYTAQPITAPGNPPAPSTGNPAITGRKQLIVTSFPGGQQLPYYREELAKSGYTPSAIVDFLRDYARAATEIGDDFLIVYPVEREQWIRAADFADTSAYLLPVPVGLAQDFWMRDFTTVGARSTVHFRYEPWYLQGEGRFAEQPFLALMSSVLGPYRRLNSSSLVLDGGNVVDTDDKAILTWRVSEENPSLTTQQIQTTIQQKLPGKTLCFLNNPDKNIDTTGHADGYVSFLDRDTLLVADYGDSTYNTMVQTLQQCFPPQTFPNLRILRFPGYSASTTTSPLIGKRRRRRKRQAVARFTSAVGSTINLAATHRGLYVPSFDSVGVANTDQLRVIQQNSGGKAVRTVDTGRLSDMGGSVRCLSWQMDSDTTVAQALLARAVPARQVTPNPNQGTPNIVGPYNPNYQGVPITPGPYNPFTQGIPNSPGPLSPYTQGIPTQYPRSPYVSPFSQYPASPYGYPFSPFSQFPRSPFGSPYSQGSRFLPSRYTAPFLG